MHKLLKSHKTKNNNTNIFLLNRSQSTILKKERKIFLSEYNEIKNLLDKYYLKVKETGSIGVLIWSIYIFYLFVELIHIKNILIIPFIITNKEMLLKINQITYTDIFEINITLAEFNKDLFKNFEKEPDFISFFVISQLIHDHIAMNMTSEIKIVMDSLENICVNMRKSKVFLPRHYYIDEQIIESCYKLLQNIKEVKS